MSARDEKGPHEGAPPAEAGELFEGLFRKQRREPVLAVSRLRKNWPGIVGEALARVTWPARIARGVLWINALDTGWAFNLQFVKSDLLGAARTFLGNTEIREVRYKAGPVPGAETVQDMAMTPARTEGTPAVPLAEQGASARAVPPAADTAAANDPPIADPKLKALFLRTSAKLRARRRPDSEEPQP